MALTISTSLSTVSQNVANNTSTVRQTITAHWTYGTYQASGATLTFNVAGVTFSKSTGFNTGRSTTGSESWSHDFTVAHNADGTKSVSAAASLKYWDGTKTASASATLATIPRATTPRLPASIELGNALTIDLSTRASSSFTHTVQCNWYGTFTTVATKTSSTSLSMNVPLSWASSFPNQKRTNLTIVVDTYSGNTLVGRTQTPVYVDAPESLTPTVTATIGNTNNTLGVYATNLSALHVAINASTQYGATITRYYGTIDGARYEGQDFTSALLSTAGQVKVVVTAVDSRGFSGSKTYTITAAEYVRPNLEGVIVHRTTADGTPDDAGSYISIGGSATFTSTGNNTAQMTAKYRQVGATEWQNVTMTSSTSGGTVSGTATFEASDVNAYEVLVAVSDKPNTTERLFNISTSYATMDWRAGGKGVAFGTTATRDGLGIDMPLYGSGILDYVYPVGSVYMSFNSANPAELFGGTWEQIQGKMLIAVGSTGQWAWLCDENQTFTLTQTEKVRYGVPENWVYKTLTAGTYTANTATFGSDPAQGFAKSVQHTLSPKVGEQGGEVEHRLRTDELPQHSHNTNQWMVSSVNNFTGYGVSISSKTNASGIFATDNAQGNTNGRATTTVGYNWTHNNMPPYLAVYMWRRTA